MPTTFQKVSSFSRLSRLYILKPAGLRIRMVKSDEALMLQLQAGDLRSFDTLVKRWEKPLLNYCYRMVNDIALAEDLRQDVFLRIYRSAQTYRPMARFSTWMYRIATNLCLDTLTKQQRRKEIPMGTYLESASEGFDEKLIDLSDAPDVALVKKETENRVRSALAHLPEDQRVVVTLRHYNGMRFHEIAEILECPISTAKSRMAAGMERLSRMLSKQE
ncbi:RNA polymerase subunit sigma [Candidatus Poribacteria bacterium]|nr:MAG: RNA polymerase subunit sigma [Candidatus Poribacteria bacterium]